MNSKFADHAIRSFLAILGGKRSLGEAKDKPVDMQFEALGAIIIMDLSNVRNASSVVSNRPSRVEAIVTEVSGILQSSRGRDSAAAEIRSR